MAEKLSSLNRHPTFGTMGKVVMETLEGMMGIAESVALVGTPSGPAHGTGSRDALDSRGRRVRRR